MRALFRRRPGPSRPVEPHVGVGAAKHLRGLAFPSSLTSEPGGDSDVFWFSFLVALLAQAAPAVSVERIDEHAFRMNIAAPAGAAVSDLQARLLPSARLACRNERPLLARYKLGEDQLDQELLCVSGEVPATPAAALPDAAWAPTPAHQQGLLAATYAYFAAKDAARYPDAYAFLSNRLKAATPLPAWIAAAREFNEAAGRPLGRRVVEISWYNHPSDAPEPGIYVAADYSAEFEKLEFVCGYVMWRLMPDGSLRLVREEQNLARKRGAKPMAAIDRDPLRARLGCKD